MRSWSRTALVAVATLAAIALLATAPSLIPCVEGRHASGLQIVCPEPIEPYAAMPEELKGAASWAWVLAEDHPEDLGYPWPDPGTGELEVRIVGPRGEAAVREWMAGNAKKLGPKTHDLPRPAVPVNFVEAERNFRRLQDIQHDIVPAKDLPDGDAIYAVGPDQRRNATVITVDRVSDRLFRALAARYGTVAIVIRVDPHRPRISY